MLDELSKKLRRIKEELEKVVTEVALNVVYVVGVGIPAVMGKILGKRFLPQASGKTNWQDYEEGEDWERMY